MNPVAFRAATIDDIDALVSLRARFLAEVASADASSPQLLLALRRYFQSALPASQFTAFLACAGPSVVAIAGLVYHQHPPTADNLSGLLPYLLNVYTLPEWRKRGLATALVKKLLLHLRAQGHARVSLHTFPQAREIYAAIGFTSVNSEMEFILPPPAEPSP